MLSDEQWQRIQAGHTAQDMDEKWDLRVSDEWLYTHRSWTGYGIHAVRFTRDAHGWRISELHVERNQDLYRSDDAYDMRLFEMIIDGHLLGLSRNDTP